MGYILQQEQRKRAEKLSEEKRKIADNEAKEDVLQTYFDRLSVLLIDKNLLALLNKSDSGKIQPEEQELLNSALDVIRARTLSILRRFENDIERKSSVMYFLLETDIVGKSKFVDRSKLNLAFSKLNGANLAFANFAGTNLSFANLTGADLKEANLSGANLSGANFIGSDLKDIKWNSETIWPDKSQFDKAINIPEDLKKELNL